MWNSGALGYHLQTLGGVHEKWNKVESINCSAVSNSLRPHRLWPAKLLCPWDCPGKNSGVGCHALLQGIFLPQGLNSSGSPELVDGFFFYYYFNWRLITLQYCHGFCHTSVWIGHMYTSVHSILKPPHTSLPTLSLQILTTPVFLPGESHGVRSLVGYSPEGHKELNMIEATEHTCIQSVQQQQKI